MMQETTPPTVGNNDPSPAGTTPAHGKPAEAPAPAQGQESAATLPSEMKRLGELLAAAMKAAAATEEAASLRGEIREGARALRREIDSTLESTREATGRVRPVDRASGGTRKLRGELADALRVVVMS
ncbi:MAG: hypothetical protein ACE5EL_03115, partial [Anaerolineae bacterium]